jgi:hypothetical protein
MTPSLYEWILILSGLGGLALGVFNYFDKRKTTAQSELTSTGDYLHDTNESIVIANSRARDAEKERRDAEVAHKKELAGLREDWRKETEFLRIEIKKLKDQVLHIEKALAYEIHLVAHLGDDPKVEAVSIKRIQASALEK